MHNFNSFDPYDAGQDKFSKILFMSAQDRLEEIIVDLRAVSCHDGLNPDRPWDWPNLTLAGFKIVRMLIKEWGSEELHAEIIGVPMQPLEDGKVLFRLPGKVFGQKKGRFIGLVEVEYKGSDRSGNKITTARNYIPFDVREDFYCDPFDPDFHNCPGRT